MVRRRGGQKALELTDAGKDILIITEWTIKCSGFGTPRFPATRLLPKPFQTLELREASGMRLTKRL
jgi:hypothetical protein